MIDMHIHGSPDVRPRVLSDIEIARQAAAHGMAAILLKSHVTITADRAALVEEAVPGIRVFGGLALNHPVGGINPYAVEAALQLGAAQIWMPTISSSAQRHDPMLPGISILRTARLARRPRGARSYRHARRNSRHRAPGNEMRFCCLYRRPARPA